MIRAARSSRATNAAQTRTSLVGLGLVLVVALAACQGATTASPSPEPTASPDASGGPGPQPTRWPTTTIEGTIALGAADGEIWKAGVDLRIAAENEDVELMWGASDGLAKLIEGIEPNVARLQSYPGTQELGDKLEVAYAGLHDAAVQVRDSITGGDPDGVVAGFTALTAAMDVYADSRQNLSESAQQAIFMKRVFNL